MKVTLNTLPATGGRKRRLTNDEQQFIFYEGRAIRLCVDMVLVVGRQILLCKRAGTPYKGKWSLPGGQMMLGEQVEEAVVRKTKGELGCKPKSIKFLDYAQFLRDGKRMHSLSLVHLVELDQQEIRLDSQHNRACLFGEIPKSVHPIHGKFLREHWEVIMGKR